MANLIITIISIALVAVAALMGAYYGGSAFIQGQAKANANTTIAQGEQIAGAWATYAADRGGAWDMSNLSMLSTNSYLTSIPTPPASVANASGDLSTAQWRLVNLSSVPGASSNFNAVYYQLADTNAGVNVCNYVAQAIAGSSGTPQSIAASTDLRGAVSTRKFDCVYVGTSSIPLAADSAVQKYVFYRAY